MSRSHVILKFAVVQRLYSLGLLARQYYTIFKYKSWLQGPCTSRKMEVNHEMSLF